MPEFSVIVPIYKAESYLQRCIESIRAQEFTDFELILINDGSPDKCGQICEQYAMKDKRICVVHQENRGVSAARNRGLSLAKGRYIVFVDSDDVLEHNYLSCMAVPNKDIDFVICGMQYVSVDGTRIRDLRFENAIILELQRDDILDMIENKALNFMCNKRFTRKIIEDKMIKFDEALSLAEDSHFIALYLCECKNVQYIEAMPYKYYKYENDTLSNYKKDNLQKWLTTNKKIVRILDERFSDIVHSSEWNKRIFNIYYFDIFNILRNKTYSDIEKYKLIKSIFQQEEYKVFCSEIYTFMAEERLYFRVLFASRKSLALLIFWKLINLKKCIADIKNK